MDQESIFTSKIEVKICANDLKICAYDVKFCAYEVKIRAILCMCTRARKQSKVLKCKVLKWINIAQAITSSDTEALHWFSTSVELLHDIVN